eukprot:2996636-Pleurochrysis_carterae.AAC.1
MSAGFERGSSCTPSRKMLLWASKDVTVFAAFRASLLILCINFHPRAQSGVGLSPGIRAPLEIGYGG